MFWNMSGTFKFNNDDVMIRQKKTNEVMDVCLYVQVLCCSGRCGKGAIPEGGRQTS